MKAMTATMPLKSPDTNPTPNNSIKTIRNAAIVPPYVYTSISCYNETNWRCVVIKTMFIEEIEDKERSLGEKFEDFGKKMGKLCDMGYDILGDKDMNEKERSEFVDILASIKGAKMAAYKIMEKYSDVPKDARDAVEKKADEFVSGLGLDK